MGFVRKQIGTDRDFGADLKELRELRGWSLDQLAGATGIPKSTIQALEEDRLDIFRDPVYAERHVKALVQALDGRVGFFLHKYRMVLEEQGFASDEKPMTFIARIKRSALFVPSKYFLLLIPLPLALVLGWYVWHQAVGLSAAPRLEISAPSEHATIDEPTIAVTGMTDPTASVTVNGLQAIVESDGVFSVTLNVPRGMTKLTITAKRRYGNMAQVTRYVTYSPEYAPAVLDLQALRPATTTSIATTTEALPAIKKQPRKARAKSSTSTDSN